MIRRLAVRRLAAVAFLVLLTLGPALAARADDYDAEISAIDNAFDAGIVRIQPGGSVSWSNDGNSPHTVTADDGSYDSGNLEPGATYTKAFDQPGVYSYFCKYHGAPGVGMTGIVVVGDVQIPSATGGGVGPGREPLPGGFAATVRVPADYPTVQEAVDHAEPGGMVLIAPGVYHESVVVTTPYLTIRGEDRNRTILDGKDQLPNGIHVIEADGVSIENLTTRHFVLNGVQWSSVFGFRASYVTAYDNGDYGIYAFDSQYGQFDHSYAGGSPDSGFYIGQCDPCHALITDSLAEHNAMGYSGTNAGGDLAIVNSEWRDNMAGIVPNTLDSEANPPQRDVLIAGNYVHDNNSTTADTKDLEYPTYGVGILIAGGVENTVDAEPGRGPGDVRHRDRPEPRREPLADARQRGARQRGSPERPGGSGARRAVGRRGLLLGEPPGHERAAAHRDVVRMRRAVPEHVRRRRPRSHREHRLAVPRCAWTAAFPHGDWRKQPAPRPQPQMAGCADRAPVPRGSIGTAAELSDPRPRRYQVGARAAGEQGGARVRDPARHVVVEPHPRPVRVRAARVPLRRVADDRAVGPDPAGVGAGLVPRAMDGGGDPGAVVRTDPVLRLRDARRSRSSFG